MIIFLNNLKDKLIANNIYPDTPAGYQNLVNLINTKFSGVDGIGYQFLEDILTISIPTRLLSSTEKTTLRNLKQDILVIREDLERRGVNEGL